MAKILLVEDDNNLREIYEARLQAEGYEIVAARDGEEALTVAMKERPDLIISDVMMPKISGFDMLDIIRSTEETKDVKVIMMTALSQAEDKARADKLGADRYLVKSQVTLEDVAKVAREVLEGGKKAPPAAEVPPVVASTTDAAAATPPTATPQQPEPQVVATAPTVAPVQQQPAPVTAPVPVPAPAVPPSTTDAAAPANPGSTTTQAPDPQQPVAPPPDTSAIGQSIEDEQSAIAAQIESFIDSKKTSESTENPAPVTAQQDESQTQQQATPSEEQREDQDEGQEHSPPKADEPAFIETPAQTPTKKKVIQPINDLTKSSAPDLHRLVENEVKKEQMQQIANDVAAKNAERVEESQAADVLKHAHDSAPVAVQAQPQEQLAPEVNINEDGTLKTPQTAPVPIPKPAVDMPVHQAPQDPEAATEQPVVPPLPSAPDSTITTPVDVPPAIAAPPPAVAPQPQAQTQPVTDTPVQVKSEPVIPHTNGSSIDGFVAGTPPSTQTTQPQPTSSVPTQPTTAPSPGPTGPPPPADNDPSAIAL